MLPLLLSPLKYRHITEILEIVVAVSRHVFVSLHVDESLSQPFRYWNMISRTGDFPSMGGQDYFVIGMIGVKADTPSAGVLR